MQDKDEPVRDDWQKRTIAAAARRVDVAATATKGDRIHEREEEEPERWDGMS